MPASGGLSIAVSGALHQSAIWVIHDTDGVQDPRGRSEDPSPLYLLSTGTMLLESLKHELDRALNRAGAMSFADARALGSPLFEDYGDPVRDPSEYFQIQTELLDSWKEEVETLHITVVARDQSRAIGGDIYLRSDGVVEIGEQKYEYINGVPRSFG